jgi:hypothetical protein
MKDLDLYQKSLDPQHWLQQDEILSCEHNNSANTLKFKKIS